MQRKHAFWTRQLPGGVITSYRYEPDIHSKICLTQHVMKFLVHSVNAFEWRCHHKGFQVISDALQYLNEFEAAGCADCVMVDRADAAFPTDPSS